MRVASFNIRNGLAFDGCNSWPFRRGAVLRTIRALDADLIALQEVYGFQLRFLLRQLAGYGAVGAPRSGRWGERTVVLYRRDVARVVGHWTRWFGEAPNRPGTRLRGARFPRIATEVAVELADKTVVRFMSTHLDEASAERRHRSAAQLVEWAGEHDGPRIVAGDLNATPDAPMFAVFASAGLRDVGADGATFHRFTGKREGRRLDYILVSSHFAVLRADVVHTKPGERLASDHWPVVAELSVAQRNAPSPPSTVST